MTRVPPGRPLSAAPDVETRDAELIEVSFTPDEPQLTPGAARAVLALLLRARENAQAGSGRT